MSTYLYPLAAILGPSNTGLAGTLTYTVQGMDGTERIAATSSGVSEVVAGSGTYKGGNATFDTTWGNVQILWKSGSTLLGYEGVNTSVALDAVRDAILNRILFGNHDTEGSVGEILQHTQGLATEAAQQATNAASSAEGAATDATALRTDYTTARAAKLDNLDAPVSEAGGNVILTPLQVAANNVLYTTRNLPRIAQNSAPSITFTVVDSDGADVDLTGKTIRFVAGYISEEAEEDDLFDDTLASSFKYETGGSGITVANTNEATVQFDSEDTALPLNGKFWLWSVDDKQLLVKGKLQIEPALIDV